MKLCVSNLAWKSTDEDLAVTLLKKHEVSGIEIAPSRFVSNQPGFGVESEKVLQKISSGVFLDFVYPSMQGICYQITGDFSSQNNARQLVSNIKPRLELAHRIGASHVVFGCPSARVLGNLTREQFDEFFNDLDSIARGLGLRIGLEPNPRGYGGEFFLTYREILDFLGAAGLPNLGIVADLGAFQENREAVSVIEENPDLLSHVHISSPGLGPISNLSQVSAVAKVLGAVEYTGWVSVEANSLTLTELDDSLYLVTEALI